MSDMKELGRVAMASKVLADAARPEGAAAKEALTDLMAQAGAERVRVTGDDGTDYGTVVLSAGSKRAQVVDEKTFTDWVAREYPDQIVAAVRPAFRDRLLAAATRSGDPVDTSTGQFIAGVEITRGDPYVSVRPSKDAAERMREALSAHGLLALMQPNGGESGG